MRHSTVHAITPPPAIQQPYLRLIDRKSGFGDSGLMRRLRISGLVGLAKRVRQELAGPISPGRLALLRRDVELNVKAIEETLRDEHLRVQSVALPSRKAYQFLKSLDFSAVVPDEPSSASSFPPESVSFRGLQSYFDDLLNRLARPSDPSQWEEFHKEIVSSSENIENSLRVRKVRPEQIKKPARQARGWLAYFSQRENLEEYCAAARRAEPVVREACPWPMRSSAAVLVHFRPLQGMYRIRGRPDAITIHLPTPMIRFDEALLRAVAQAAFKKGGDRKLVHDATGREPYRRIASAIEMLGGVVSQTRGMHHDLAASFERVNTAYFGGSMSRPQLVWSRTFAVRKFGHYDHAHDTVMVNMAMDSKTVPEPAVDFIVYHELLHRQLGVIWQSDRMAAHTPEFRERERQFRQYDQAKAVLRKLATER